MSAPNLLVSALLAPAEFVVNQLLKQDTLLAGKLARHEGTVLAVTCTSPAVTVYLVIEEVKVRLVQDWSGEVTAAFTGSLPALAGLLLQERPSLQDSGIEVSGDMQEAQEIQKLLAASSIDWAFHLSKFFGDVPVQAAGDLAGDVSEAVRQGADSLKRDLDEYIHEEARVLPGKAELEIFYADLDALKLRLDRLAARLDALGDSPAGKSD